MSTVDDAIMAMEEPMRRIATALSRDEFESIIESMLDDVYADADD